MSSQEFVLTLADGTRLALRAGDGDAARVVSFFARAARLAPALAPLPPGTRRLLAVAGDHGQRSRATNEADVVCRLEPSGVQRPRRRRRVAGLGAVVPILEPLTEEQWFWQQLARLSACIAGETHPRGGVLLHSGLAALPSLPLIPCAASRSAARGSRPEGGPGIGSPPPTGEGQGGGERDGGILLAGRSGVGKSTASMRLPPPWRALADDVTLVVRDEAPHAGGVYWAHPWPTWSWFFGTEDRRPGGGTWDVQQAVALRAIFILEQGEEDRAEPIGLGHAVVLLTELARQTSRHLPRDMSLDEIVAFNLQRFENLCALVRAVPAYLLHVSRRGAFWEEIARALQ